MRCYQVSIIRYCSKIYTAGSAEDVYTLDYCSVDLRALPVVIHIVIGKIFAPIPFVSILPLIEIVRTQFL